MASLIFQHGGTPDDYLQAYHLAVMAVELGARVNMQGWYRAEQENGELELGWTRIPFAPELGHTVVQAERTDLTETTVGERPAIWVGGWRLVLVCPFL